MDDFLEHGGSKMSELANIIQQKTIKKVFDQRSDFIIIGLIGTIDTDISSAVNILSSDFGEINLPDDRNGDSIIGSLEYKNIYKFAEKNWKKFDVIRASDIIFTYILENSFTLERFEEDIKKNIEQDVDFVSACLNELRDTYANVNEEYLDNDEIKKELDVTMTEINTKGLFQVLFQRNRELGEYIDVLRTKKGAEYNTRTTLSLYVYTKYFLPVVRKRVKNELSIDTYISLFQRYGNEIRFFGTLDMRVWADRLENIESILNFDYFYSIAKRINTFIKIRRAPSSNKKSIPVRIVIDSLKNQYEFGFLKDRYSAYYTIALLENENSYNKANETFAVSNYTTLYENPHFIKKNFMHFVSLLIEYTQRQTTNIEQHTYDYIQALKTSEIFMDYIKQKLEVYNWEERRIPVFPEIRIVEYSREFARMGILEDEYLYYFEILRDPIRTFCLLSGVFIFYLQDIQSSTQNADIFFAVSSEGRYSGQNLKYQIVKYVSLIMHPGLVPPTKIERCMQIAFSAKVNSGCISRQVGAVVTDKDYNILSIGWNDVPYGRVPCVYRNLKNLKNNADENVYSDFEREESRVFRAHIEGYDFTDYKKVQDISNGVPLTYCFKSEYCKITHERAQENSRAMHGEERAFHSCLNKEAAIDGCLFTTSSSCERCTIIANEYRVKKIYYIEDYAGLSQTHVNASGNEKDRAEFILFKGAIGVAYMKLYTPLLPMKDELQLRGVESLHRDV